MQTWQHISVICVFWLFLFGCSSIFPTWEGRKIVSVSVGPNPVQAGGIAYIDVKTKTKLSGLQPAIAYSVDINVTGGKLYLSHEDAMAGGEPEDIWDENGSQRIQSWGEAWWVAPDGPQMVTMIVRFASDEKIVMVEVLP